MIFALNVGCTNVHVFCIFSLSQNDKKTPPQGKNSLQRLQSSPKKATGRRKFKQRNVMPRLLSKRRET